MRRLFLSIYFLMVIFVLYISIVYIFSLNDFNFLKKIYKSKKIESYNPRKERDHEKYRKSI